MRFSFVSAAAVAAALMSAPAALAQSASEDFAALLEDHWTYTLEQNPTFATSLGVRDHDGRLGSLSVATQNAQTEQARRFLARLEAIDVADLSDDDAFNHRMFKYNLEQSIEAADHNGVYLQFTTYYGWHTGFASMPRQAPFFTEADYDSYVGRLNDYRRYNAEGIEVLRAAIEAGWTQPCEPLAGYETTISTYVIDDAEESAFFAPFETMPDSISARDQRRLRQAGLRAIERSVIPAYAEFLTFFEDEYMANCRDEVGASAMPGGPAFYAQRAKSFTTTDMTPDEIHETGLSEVARIRAEMGEIIEEVEFEGDFKAFQEFLRTDERFYVETPDELMRHASYVAKKADGELPKLFGKLPRMSYTVKPVPEAIAEKTTTAYYSSPAGDGTRSGVYFVNTSKLDQRPLFELEALTLHEAVPGHHFQIALRQEMENVPQFRRFSSYTAYTEGWALYAERLGLEMGFYEDPYSNFGRLSYEMWRACRLVVDTGLHAKGWTRQQAIDFMAENTALSLHNIESEVDRYITWPGQALGYKIGELKIRELRARAEAALGDEFDVRAFHDVVLATGGVPLAILEEIVDAWIAEQPA